MGGRRTTAILACLAGAALLAAVAALFLDGEGPPAPPPRVPDPSPAETGKRTPPANPAVRPGNPGTKRPPAVPFSAEEDAPPASERTSVPAGWKPWARLRFVDAKTREEIPFRRGRVALAVPRGEQELLVPEPWRRAEDGRVEVFRSEDERGLPFGVDRKEWEASPVEIRIPGRTTRRFGSRAEISGDRDIEMAAAAPSVRGIVKLGRGLEGKRVHMDLEPGDPTRDPRRPDAMPSGGATEAGPFSWYDVPDGRWRLVVRVRAGEDESAMAVRVFDKAGAEADLGEIVVLPPSTLRARVVARDGTGVLDRDLALHRGGTGEVLTTEDIDDGGWVVFRGLEADTEYRAVSSLDGVEGTVRTPAEGGGDLRLEIPWEHQGVRCRIRFTVEGQDPILWGEIVEGPTLDKGAWRKDGFLEHDMAAGEYLFGFFARPVGKDAPVRVYATFTVPDQPLWDATVDLKERK